MMSERGAAPPDYHEFAAARAGQLFRVAYLMCGNWHEAEDLVQTSLAKLYVAWDRVQKREGVDSYARKILLNTYLSQRRLKRSSETPVAVIADIAGPRTDADLRIILVAALRSLPPRSRAVVVLRYLEDQSIEAVAAMLDATPSAIKSLNTRALAQLREQLGKDQELLFNT
jgi:RNA polymerase sigma-70 factor (sigma-E family)